MLGNNFQGSFKAPGSRDPPRNAPVAQGGVTSDPKFAQATNKAQQISTVETNMMQLNIQRDKLKDELSKMPEHAKKAAQIRRREYLEQETSLLSRNIATLKQKLKDLSAY